MHKVQNSRLLLAVICLTFLISCSSGGGGSSGEIPNSTATILHNYSDDIGSGVIRVSEGEFGTGYVISPSVALFTQSYNSPDEGETINPVEISNLMRYDSNQYGVLSRERSQLTTQAQAQV